MIGGSAIPGIGPAIGIGGKVANAIGAGAQAAGNVASDVGRVTGGAGAGLTEQRLAEAAANRGVDQARLARSGQQIGQNTSRDAQALQRAQFGIDSASARAKQAALGDAQHNIQDVNIDFAPKTGALPKFNVTGGLRPSMLGPNARQAGDELSKQALMALMTKSDVPAASPLVDMPQIGDYTKAGAGEKTLQGIGLGSSIWGALQPALQGIGQNQQAAQPTMGTPGAPVLSPGDVAYGQGRSPQLLPQPEGQDALLNPDLLNPNRQARNPYGVTF